MMSKTSSSLSSANLTAAGYESRTQQQQQQPEKKTEYQKKEDAQTQQQRQAAAKLALRKQLEKTLLQVIYNRSFQDPEQFWMLLKDLSFFVQCFG